MLLDIGLQAVGGVLGTVPQPLGRAAHAFGRAIEPPTWYMADDVVAAGLDGILFPSQARPGGTNLVIYGSSLRPAAQLAAYDPDNRLSATVP